MNCKKTKKYCVQNRSYIKIIHESEQLNKNNIKFANAQLLL